MSVFSKLATQIVDFGTIKTNPRKDITYNPSGKVFRLTPHHMATVGVSAADMAKRHRDGTQNASASYYIGNDGTICGAVSEDRRPWTSDSRTNDYKAITFEVANCSGEPDWKISDAAYKSLVAVCADICLRYGIDPHYDGTVNGTITMHCQFNATRCPGEYLKEIITSGKFERDIKAAMGTSDEKYIWNWLTNAIGNAYGVAGLMGNLQAESGLRSNNLENSKEGKLGFTDVTYTAAVDNNSYKNFATDAAGYGLAQWTSSGRKAGLLQYKVQKNVSIADVTMQLEYLLKELQGPYAGVLSTLRMATSVRQASDAVLLRFEIPHDRSESVQKYRASLGQGFYDKYSYVVRIMADELNIRSGAGTEYPIVQTVKRGEAFTIVEVQSGWGKLKSGVGWISLEYTERV